MAITIKTANAQTNDNQYKTMYTFTKIDSKMKVKGKNSTKGKILRCWQNQQLCLIVSTCHGFTVSYLGRVV